MAFTYLPHKLNQSHLSVWGVPGNYSIRMTTLKYVRESGFELGTKNYSAKGTVNSSKLDNNLSRARQKVFGYALCNPWELFGTFTLDPKKFTRTDLNKFRSSFSQWIRNQNKKNGTEIKYLLIPELHADQQSWHMHGLFLGLPTELLHRFVVGDTMGKSIADKVFRGDVVYNWGGYAEKFGYCSLEPVRDHNAVSFYITKYITKDLLRSVVSLNSHSFFASQGLNTPTTIKKGTFCGQVEYDYSNDYCSIMTADYSDELLNYLTDNIVTDYS